MHVWDGVVPEADIQVYGKAGYGGIVGPGKKPALMVVDVTTAFLGDRPEPALKSIERFPNSCGEAGWKALEEIRKLVEAARGGGIPIIYSAGAAKGTWQAGRWAEKHRRTLESQNRELSTKENIPSQIAPRQEDFVVEKMKPSAFFGTALASHLVSLGVDTLVVTGCATSGCVRATVTDAFSYNFRVLVVEEGTFDRGEVSHRVNLFDLNQKYADVVSTETALRYLKSASAMRETAGPTSEPPAFSYDSM
ncbi:MAG TPA: isochorismatase family protein [Nitrososphaerales archaeon]|nr:isochorismatase family protein [Nitrososphaerales archaeon]